MNSNGFIWIETLVSLNIVLIVMTIIVPIYTTVQKEKLIIKERSLTSLQLFNELQFVLNDSSETERSFTKHIEQREVNFQFSIEDDYVKGCATWKNAKGKNEERCLYGIANE